MSDALQDKIPSFGAKGQKAEIGLGGSGAALMSGSTRSAFEIAIIILVAVAMIGGAELAIRLFEVPLYILPPPSAIGAALISEWPFLWPHLVTTICELLIGFTIGASIGFILAA